MAATWGLSGMLEVSVRLFLWIVTSSSQIASVSYYRFIHLAVVTTLLSFLRNSQVRLLFSASLFTGAFIWMAVTAYNVDRAEIQVFAIMSLITLGIIIAAGAVFALLLFLLRRGRSKDGLLAEIENIERETAKETPPEDSDVSRPAH
jgi:hypothetical protein